jgi:hypothetical protein
MKLYINFAARIRETVESQTKERFQYKLLIKFLREARDDVGFAKCFSMVRKNFKVTPANAMRE